MGSLLLAVSMAGTSLLRIVLCITILASHSSEGKSKGEETEAHEAAHQEVSNDENQNPLRNIRSTERKKYKSSKQKHKTRGQISGKVGNTRRENIKNKTK